MTAESFTGSDILTKEAVKDGNYVENKSLIDIPIDSKYLQVPCTQGKMQIIRYKKHEASGKIFPITWRGTPQEYIQATSEPKGSVIFTSDLTPKIIMLYNNALFRRAAIFAGDMAEIWGIVLGARGLLQLFTATQVASISAAGRGAAGTVAAVSREAARREAWEIEKKALQETGKKAVKSAEKEGSGPLYVNLILIWYKIGMNFFELCYLLLGTPSLLINKIAIENDQLHIAVNSLQNQADCPICNERSDSLHSTYLRHPRDLPWASVPVVLQITVKRFFCHNPSCRKKTFAERFPDLVGRYQRRTKRVQEKQQRLSTNTSARAAELLLEDHQIGLSNTSINRLLRSLPEPPFAPVHILGVDDWAKRKGQRYGTILIDLEHHQVIDLLKDRTADTLADWLIQHPEIEVVSRDRSQTYAEAITRGAPSAIQVADRWHLLHNLSDTVYLLLQQEAKTIHEQFALTHKPLPSLPEKTPSATQKPLTSAEQRRKERMEQAEALRQKGWSQKEIARHLHIHPKTVRRYRNHPSPRFERTRTRHWIDAYKPYLLQRWNEGCHNATQLYHEIQSKGFRGHVSSVMNFVRTLREASGLPARARKTTTDHPLPVNLVATVPTLRTLTWWILKRPEDRVESDENLLAQICEGQPKLIETVALARGFAETVRQQQEDQLTPWLEQASHCKYPLWCSFAESLKQDEKAVRAALRFSWSIGQTEGQVNRLKCVKRLMYGRAKDDLLRKRVLWQGKMTFT